MLLFGGKVINTEQKGDNVCITAVILNPLDHIGAVHVKNEKPVLRKC